MPMRIAVLLVLLLPFGYLVYGALFNALGADPANEIIDVSALVAMTLLFAVVLLPKRAVFNIHWRSYRRMLGLYAFFYASLHILAVTLYEFGASITVFWSETIDKPFIWLGVIAWLALLPLAMTSTQAWRIRLKRRWKALHQLVYLALLAVAVHYGMQLRGDLLAYAWLVPLTIYVLGMKVWIQIRGRSPRTPTPL